jgi:hypothetical protein
MEMSITVKRPANIVKKKILSLEEQRVMLADKRRIAKQARMVLEGEWQSNEITIYDIGEEGGAIRYGGQTDSVGFVDADTTEDQKGGVEFMAINLISRNKQLIHSQLCSNPPAVMTSPVSNEEEDRLSAIAGEQACTYARDRYSLIDTVALATNSVFDYGTGFIKNIYDGALGDIGPIQDSPDTLTMEGDNSYSIPRVWDMYLDPNAVSTNTIKWLFEDMYVTLDEAVMMFGDEHIEKLKKEVQEVVNTDAQTSDNSESMLFNTKYNVIKICEYWETGLPENCYQGRHGYCLDDGYILQPLGPSPCKFKVKPNTPNSAYRARLPYSILTYIDIPNSPWGRSPTAYTSRQQEMLNNCISVMISNAEVNGTPKVLLPKMSVDKENVTNNPADIWEYNVTEGVPPYIIQSANVAQDISNLIGMLERFINDGWGVNDAMFGKQQRETSALLMQLSTMQGNLIRQRLFDKYILFVKDIYELQLQYCIEYWDTNRIIKIVGKDNIAYARKLKGADLVGGYSIIVEYGQSFALDPITRGEQILKFSELFLQSGMQPRDLVKKLRLSELRNTYDEFKKADDKGMEIVERIKATGIQVPISSKYQDHIGIIGYLTKYTMENEFELLDENIRELINQHIDMRYEVQVQNTTAQAATQPQPPQMPPAGPQ